MASLFTLVVALSTMTAAGQSPAPMPVVANPYSDPYSYRETPVYVELNLMLNPVYIAQFSGKFRLDGHRLPILNAYRPKFYATQPFQNAFSDLGETADQANSIYSSWRLPFLDSSHHSFFHHIRFVFGATHEKMEGDSNQTVDYRYYDGGTEATFLLEKNISFNLSKLQYEKTGIVFGINIQAGFFESVAKVRTDIHYNGDSIKSRSTQRYQLPSPYNGAGWMAGVDMEIGGMVCHTSFLGLDSLSDCGIGRGLFWFFRHVGVTLATKIEVMELTSADGVNIYGGTSGPGLPGVAPGSISQGRLRINNYSLFFAGPIINFKWIKLK
jgi:hypothetical protein